jgi:hypothetical protein
MVFEKFEAWTFLTPGPTELFAASWQFWGQRGYDLKSMGPSRFQGRSFQSTLGIHRVVDLTVLAAGSGSVVQTRFRADVREDVALGGVVVAVLLLPLAVVGAAISWHEYETDWSQERWAFWNFLVGGGKAQPAPNAPVPAAPAPPSALSQTPAPPADFPATGPGAAPLPTSVAGPVPSATKASTMTVSTTARCPACGMPATGEGKFCASCGVAIPRP